jgi:hypothetical protein
MTRNEVVRLPQSAFDAYICGMSLCAQLLQQDGKTQSARKVRGEIIALKTERMQEANRRRILFADPSGELWELRKQAEGKACLVSAERPGRARNVPSRQMGTKFRKVAEA